jgi:hypothetical protein
VREWEGEITVSRLASAGSRPAQSSARHPSPSRSGPRTPRSAAEPASRLRSSASRLLLLALAFAVDVKTIQRRPLNSLDLMLYPSHTRIASLSARSSCASTTNFSPRHATHYKFPSRRDASHTVGASLRPRHVLGTPLLACGSATAPGLDQPRRVSLVISAADSPTSSASS